jgi:hypothetical protein
MAKIKLTTQGDVPRFQHNGLSISDAWTEVELDSMNDDTRQALVDYVGRFVRVHDDDMDAFKSYLSSHGLEYNADDGRVHDPKKEAEEKAAAEERARTGATATATDVPREPAHPSGSPRPEGTGTFQTPPGTEAGARVVDSDSGGGAARDTVTRGERDTSPDKPSTLGKPIGSKDRGR